MFYPFWMMITFCFSELRIRIPEITHISLISTQHMSVSDVWALVFRTLGGLRLRKIWFWWAGGPRLRLDISLMSLNVWLDNVRQQADVSKHTIFYTDFLSWKLLQILGTHITDNMNTAIPRLAWFLWQEKNHVSQKSCYASMYVLIIKKFP